MGLLPCIADAGGLAIGDGNSMDGICVLMIENKDVMISTTGRDVEATSLIRIGFQTGAGWSRSATAT
jgi:transcriptional regulator of acetoin/glycerol metabolism